METLKNEKTFSKLFVRCAKDNGKYIQLLHYIKKYYPNTKTYTVQLLNTKSITEQAQNEIKLKNEIMTEYPRFSKQSEYFNDFSYYIANNIGINECYDIFKNFLIKQYGKKCLESYEKNILQDSYNLAMSEIKRYKDIIKPNIKNLTSKNVILYLAPLSYLYYGFSWRNTKEGFEYWKNINQKWLNYIMSYILENKL